jgi:hypothetical protein
MNNWICAKCDTLQNNIYGCEYCGNKRPSIESLQRQIKERDELLRQCYKYAPFEGKLRGKIEAILEESNNG